MPDENTEVTQAPEAQYLLPDDEIPISEFEGVAAGGEPAGAAQEAGVAESSAPAPETNTPAPDPATSWQGVRDAAAAYGVQFPETVQDDRAALMHLIEQGRQQHLHAELGRQLAPKATQLRQFFEQQAAPPTPEKHPWDEPEGWRPEFAQLVQFTDAGVYVGKTPAVPQSIVDKANEYAAYLQRINDPKVQEQRIAYVAEQRANALLDKRFNEYREQMELQQIEQRNADFLYERDGQGRPQVGRDGRPVLSIPGARYLSIVQELRQYGVTAPAQLDALAKRLVGGEIAASRFATQQSSAQATQRTAQSAGRPNRNPLQSLTAVERRETPSATEPMGPWSLADRILRDLDEAGTTDADIALSIAG